jgi:Tol biopolymer transport system component
MKRVLICLAAAILAQGQEPKANESAAKKDEKKPALSLKGDRKIEFSTDEGTWLSLDVSPDGKKILFELVGDLYTLPVEGGEAKPLLTGMAFDSQPVYSPDGKRIAFISDREGAENLFLADADGKNIKPLTKDQESNFVSPAWTPDGQYVLVTRTKSLLGARELWLYNVNGGAGVQITKESAKPETPRDKRLNVLGPVASPDGKFIYYAKRNGLFSYNVNFPLWQIVRRDRTTGDEDVITDEPGSAFRPLLSRDGKKLVYGTRFETQTGLKIRDLETGEEHWLKYPIQRDDQESIASRDVLPGYAFTPDDQAIILNYAGKIHRVEVKSGVDTVIPFEAKVSQELGPKLAFPIRVDQGPVKARLIQGPAQSPDGKLVAFSALTHLYVSPIPAAGAPKRLTNADAREYQPAWSPDGQWIAYVTWTSAGGEIWKTRADGSGAPQQLTRTAAFYRDPAWSPDGSKIVALRAATETRNEMEVEFGQPTGMDVIWIPAAGGDAALIAPARGSGQPHFVANEPDRVYVYSPGGLISMRYDGTDKRTLLKVVGKNREFTPEAPAADDVRINPDGQNAIALVENQLWLLAVPRTGETPQVDVSAPSIPVKKLTRVGADYMGWSGDGKSVYWGLGASLFRQSLATVTYDEPEKKDEAAKKDDAPPPPAKILYDEFPFSIVVPRHTPTGSVVLRGAQVITMKGDEVVANADVVVTDNRIVGAGKRGTIAVPAGAKLIDVKGMTIMPGIVDVHPHWFEIRRKVLDLENWDFLANLAYGVTAGRDPQTSTNDMFAYQDLVDTGEILGPRAYSTGPGVFDDSDFQSAQDALDVVKKYQAYYRTHALKSYVVGNRKQRQWMVEACRELKIMPTTEGALDLKLDMTHVIDGFSGNEHALPIVPLYKDVVEMFAKSGIAYTPTLLVAYGGPFAENYFFETTEVHNDPKIRNFFPHGVLDSKTQRRPWFTKDEQVFPKLAASAAKIVRDGGIVGIGGHGQMQGIQVHWEMWALQSGGLTNMETLRAATLNGAKAIGLSEDLGSLEAGKLADLIVLKADPLKDIRNTNTIQYVMKNGELFEGDTLNEIWPQQKPLPMQWWQKQNEEIKKMTGGVN